MCRKFRGSPPRLSAQIRVNSVCFWERLTSDESPFCTACTFVRAFGGQSPASNGRRKFAALVAGGKTVFSFDREKRRVARIMPFCHVTMHAAPGRKSIRRFSTNLLAEQCHAAATIRLGNIALFKGSLRY